MRYLKQVWFLIILAVFVIMFGCASSDKTTTANENPNVNENPNANIFKEITFDELSEEEREYVLQVQHEPGVHHYGDLLVVSLGEKPTGGYDISFVRTETDHDNEALRLYVRVTEPQPGEMVTEAITYPILVGRLADSVDLPVQVFDADTDEVIFP